MPAKFSPEGLLEAALREIEISGRSFAEIASASGIPVSQSAFALALKGTKPFEREIANRLLDLMIQVKQLHQAISLPGEHSPVEPIPINWTRTEVISRALAFRRMHKVLAEDGDHVFSELAQRATKDVI